QLVGAAYFEPFVRSYIEQFKFKTVTTGEFRDHFVAFYEALAQAAESEAAEASSTPSDTPKKKNRSRRGGGGKPTPMPKASPEGAKKRAEETASICKAVSELDWEAIFFSTGLPPSDQVTSFQNTLSAAAEALAAAWIQFAAQGSQGGGPGDYTTAPANTSCDISVWSAQQKNVFLEQLLQHSKSSPLSPEEVFPVPFLECLDATYNFSASHNAEIMLRWQSLCLLSEADWITPHVVAFITSQGRMKFARPLYRLLRASSKARQLAIDTFELHQDTYHPIARKMIAADLKRADAAEAAEAEEALGEQVRAEAENAALAADLAASLSPPPVSP
ncbi:leukotriene A4 hydrolase, partial [Ochromonadaceae sp. CCMP2298]